MALWAACSICGANACDVCAQFVNSCDVSWCAYVTQVLMISANPEAWAFQPQNTLKLKPWKKETTDTTLLDLIPMLQVRRCKSPVQLLVGLAPACISSACTSPRSSLRQRTWAMCATLSSRCDQMGVSAACLLKSDVRLAGTMMASRTSPRPSKQG